MSYIGQIDWRAIKEKAEAEKQRLLAQKEKVLEKAGEEAQKIGAKAVMPGVTRAGGMGILIGAGLAVAAVFMYMKGRK